MLTAEEIVKTYDLEHKTWTYKGLHAVLHTLFPIGHMMLETWTKNYGESFSFSLFFIEKDFVHWYWNDEDMVKMRTSLIKRVASDSTYLEKMVETWHAKLRTFEAVYAPITADLLQSLSNRELLNLYHEFFQAYMDECSLAVGVQDPFSMHSERFLEPALKAELPADKANEYFVTLLTPVTESFINQELKARYSLLIAIQKDHELTEVFLNPGNIVSRLEKEFPDFYADLHEHVLQYHWLHNNYAKVTYLDEVYFAQELQDLLKKGVNPEVEIKTLEDSFASAVSKKQTLLSELHLSKEVRDLITIADTFGYMQDERKKYVLISNYYQQLFRDEVGKRVNLTSQEMDYTVELELEHVLLGDTIDRQELKDRRDFCACFQDSTGYSVLTGKEARQLYEVVTKSEGAEEKTLTGQTASLGKVTGLVRIIHKIHHVANMVEGDILVATMTRPEMIVAINKAAAIVTDEGGVTCHAAIVSRELNIPCVIGTKRATRVLKDGDRVEVDADRGTVKIIK